MDTEGPKCHFPDLDINETRSLKKEKVFCLSFIMQHSNGRALLVTAVTKMFSKFNIDQGAQKLTGENLKVAWAEFSTLSMPVFAMSVIARHGQARPHLELKTQVRFCPVGSRLFMHRCYT